MNIKNMFTAFIGQATSGLALFKHTKWLIFFTIFSMLSACGSSSEDIDQDSQAPVITLNGEVDINVIIGDEYQDLGAVAQDNIDGNITITTVGQVDTSTVGSYIITYTATDSADNSIFISRTVNVLELDVTPPQISLIGLSPLSINEGGFYIEYGASAEDERDGVLDVAISGTVNSNVPGSYSVTYTAQDTAGNKASLVRTVDVSDLTPPVITLNGAAQISMREDTQYSELGAIAVDAVNGPVNVEISSSINTATPASYLVNYSAVDSAGNRANVTRTINVIDVTAPVIILNGQRVLIQNEDSAYTEAGASAIDNLDVTVNVVISGTLDPTTPGTYTLTYTATDMAGNTATTTRSITFSDITPPVIMLAGASNINASFNSPYIDAGATATDNSSETIGVSVAGTVNTSIIGRYEITYSATDSAANINTTIRTVNVVDITPPVITLNGDNTFIQNEDVSYTEAGATAQDDVNGEVEVVISGAIDSTTPGTYALTYTATDAAGNTANKIRTINIVDITAPVITLNGDNSVTQNEDTVYTEAGATAQDNLDGTIDVVISGALDSTTPGIYVLTYTATDSTGNAASLIRTINIVDITAPVITLNGDNPFTQNEDAPYAEAGATAQDNLDGDIEVIISGNIDDTAPGTYALNYTATDAAGNTASLSRVIIVLDTTAPVITLNGDNPFTQNEDMAYTEAGATAQDNLDDEIEVVISGNIDDTTPGIYVLTYNATDAAGNTASLTRSINVLDKTPPVITLNGDNFFTQNEDVAYIEVGAFAQDNLDGEIEVVIGGNIDDTTPGTYTLSYTATDVAGNATSLTRTINILDTTVPVIILNGDNPFTQDEDTAYTEAGATAQDNLDGTVDVVISGQLDPATPGTYTLNYTATDAAGNTASLIRTVNILDTTAPVITLSGDNPFTQNEDTIYTEVGANAQDNLDGEIEVVISGTLDSTVPGTYLLTYTATDAAGNAANLTRTINILDTTAPVISLNGDNPFTQNEDAPYTEAGATAQDNLDGELEVVISGALDATAPGIYTLSYTATDAAGNAASLTRIITVLDTTAPVITLEGENPYTQNDDTAYIEPGYSAKDNSGEAISVIVSGAVTANTPGSYTLTYTASDSASNTSTVMRTINVADVTPPVITLLGEANINVPFNTPYTDAGATATDNSGEIINVTVTGAVNTAIIGGYELTYTATDSATNTSTTIRTLNVVDITPPVITLNGSNAITIIQDRVYADSVTATDDVDGSVAVTIAGNLDTGAIGTYTQNYTAIDAAGNQTTATRTIIVREPLAFITTWKTDNEGVSDDNQITITTTTSNQNYTVDWGDDSQDAGVTAGITHTYSSAGTYTVSISGDFKNIQFGTNTDNKKLLSIEQWGEGQWSTMYSAFYGCTNLVSNAIDVPDLSQVTNMSRMFYGAGVFNGDISQWDVSNVTDMSWMFVAAEAFNGDISQWNVSNVTDMSKMFAHTKVFNRNISQWDVSSVTNMYAMFSSTGAFNGDISLWDVSNVTNMSWMFSYTKVFNGDIGQWDVYSVTSMSNMFYITTAFNRDINQWDVSSVTDMGAMFNLATAFNGDISQWDVSSVTNMSNMFYGATVFNGDISQWDVSSVTNMGGVFSNSSAFNGDISQWDVSKVTSMSSMFNGATAFNGDLSQWDVSSVTDMNRMFSAATAFNGDISQWDVSSVTDMDRMFSSAFNGDISQWDVSSVTDMSWMFYSAAAFNGDISQWDVSSVTNMSYMFSSATAFNGDISQWDVSSVTNMSQMFAYTGAFNGDISQWDVSSVMHMHSMFSNSGAFNGDISQWDVSQVTDMRWMFKAADAFNGNISQWDVSSVTSMGSLFQSANAFNGDISQWDVSQVTDMRWMFDGVTLPTINYDALLQGWSSQILQSNVEFDGGDSQYSSAAQSARDSLVNSYGWTVTDGGLQAAE